MHFDTNLFREVLHKILDADKIVITSHKSPDGDSIGSSLGLYHVIKNLHKNVVICHPDKAPYFFNWITGIDEILLYNNDKESVENAVQNADLIFCLDYNAYDRLGNEFGDSVKHSKAVKILIDHHQQPSIDAIVSVSNTQIASTCELIFELIFHSDNLHLLNKKVADFLYLGIMTDTGSFRYPSVSQRTHEIIAKLLETGMEHAIIHEHIFDSNTVDRLKLKSYAVVEKLEIMANYPIGIITLTNEELTRFNYQKGDTEGLVNTILSIENILVAAIFIEHEEGIKISFRSKGDYFVNELAYKYFNGGGHKYAAGGFSKENLISTSNLFKELILGGFYA